MKLRDDHPDEVTDLDIASAPPEVTRQVAVDAHLVGQSRKPDRYSALIVVTGEDRGPVAISSNTLLGLWLSMGARLWEYRRYLKAPPRSADGP